MLVLWIFISVVAISVVFAAAAIIPALLCKEEDDGLDDMPNEEARRRLGLDRPESIPHLPVHHVSRVSASSPSHPTGSMPDPMVGPSMTWVGSTWNVVPQSGQVAHKVGNELAMRFAKEGHRVTVRGEVCLVAPNRTAVSESDGRLVLTRSELAELLEDNRVDAAHFLQDPYGFWLDGMTLPAKSLRYLDSKPKGNCLWLVEEGVLSDLYDSDKWELGSKRSHSAKSPKDRQGKSWTSFDGRHMNARKLAAQVINDLDDLF